MPLDLSPNDDFSNEARNKGFGQGRLLTWVYYILLDILCYDNLYWPDSPNDMQKILQPSVNLPEFFFILGLRTFILDLRALLHRNRVSTLGPAGTRLVDIMQVGAGGGKLWRQP